MTLSLDTSAIVDILRGNSAASRTRFRAARASSAPLVLSSLVLHELEYGALCSARPAVHRLRFQEIVAGLPVETFGPADALAAAGVRRALRAAGHDIGALDTLIAGQALARGWSVITSNVRDFGRVHGLSVIDWSAEEET